MFYAPGGTGSICEEIRGITRVDKLLYILLQEEEVWKHLQDELDFEPYDFGPYSNKLYDYVETLKDSGLLIAKNAGVSNVEQDFDALVMEFETADVSIPKSDVRVESMVLSEKGRKVGEKLFDVLTPEERDALVRVKKRFNQIPLKDLLRYVYTRFPQSATKSVVRDSILGESRFGTRPELTPFIREEEDFRE